MRKVLQNGMSFANERVFPAVSLRVRYYFLRYNFASILSVSLNFVLGDFFMQKKLKRLFLSDLMLDATETQRIAYVGIMSALCVVCNNTGIEVNFNYVTRFNFLGRFGAFKTSLPRKTHGISRSKIIPYAFYIAEGATHSQKYSPPCHLRTSISPTPI